MKLWQKGTRLDPRVEAFTVGRDPVLDHELIPFDCRASIAHAKMLKSVGILKAGEARALVKELERIVVLWKDGQFRVGTGDEDGHTAIENHLVKKLGAAGKKIHTARSRNDQVLTALRLYSKDRLGEVRSGGARPPQGIGRSQPPVQLRRIPGIHPLAKGHALHRRQILPGLRRRVER